MDIIFYIFISRRNFKMTRVPARQGRYVLWTGCDICLDTRRVECFDKPGNCDLLARLALVECIEQNNYIAEQVLKFGATSRENACKVRTTRLLFGSLQRLKEGSVRRITYIGPQELADKTFANIRGCLYASIFSLEVYVYGSIPLGAEPVNSEGPKISQMGSKGQTLIRTSLNRLQSVSFQDEGFITCSVTDKTLRALLHPVFEFF